MDQYEEPDLNSGTPWSAWDDRDIRWGLDHGRSVEETASFLCRTSSEIRQRIGEIAEADAIGDPSLLRDRLIDRERIALETYRDARAAMALIREAVEDCAPPGAVPGGECLTPEFTVEAEALVRTIYRIAGGRRPAGPREGRGDSDDAVTRPLPAGAAQRAAGGCPGLSPSGAKPRPEPHSGQSAAALP